MVASTRTLGVIIVGLVIGLSACGPAPTSTGTGGSPVDGAVMTIQAATGTSAAVTATAYRVSADETMVAAQGTAEAAGHMTATAQANVTATLVAGTATAIVPTQTEAARVSNVAATQDAIALSMQADAATAQARMNVQSLTHNDALVQLDIDQRQDDQRLDNWSRIARLALAGLAVVVAVVLIVLIAATRTLAWAADRKAQRELIRSGSGQDRPAGRGYETQPAPIRIVDPPALPAPGSRKQQVDILRNDHLLLEGARANWDQFVSWPDNKLIPMGVAVGGPVFLDVRSSPHLAILGSSRMGKSTGGILPVAGFYLSRGAHVVFLNERASNFSPFYAHPNALHLRSFSLDARLSQAQRTIAAFLQEMERRDTILHREGFDSWFEYVRDSGVDEAGHIVAVIDEYLSLLARASSAARDSFMGDLVELTSEAAKFGIGVVLAATDPRRDALGAKGYTALQQCTRMVFGFRGEGPSRSALGDNSAVNLPVGHFVLETVAGQRRAAVAFNPSPADMSRLMTHWPASYQPIPAGLAPLLESNGDNSDRPATVDCGTDHLEARRHGFERLVVEDASLVVKYTGSDLRTRTGIARRLAEDGHVGWGSSGENVRRVERALEYLTRVKGNSWAADLLGGAGIGSIVESENNLVMAYQD